MENLDINCILQRSDNVQKIQRWLIEFENNKNNSLIKRGLYLYGAPGVGKTNFISKILDELHYDIIRYDAGDIRNKSIIDTITKHNMADKNILSMFNKIPQKIVIIMDEIDGMNNGDKGGINALIKLIRPKKTKKQKMEETTLNPIICIGNYHQDKKIKELMKVCTIIELKIPTDAQINEIILEIMPSLDSNLRKNIVGFVRGDLKKLDSIYKIYVNQQSILKNEIIQNLFQKKSYNEDAKEITRCILSEKFTLKNHLTVMNETDRTIVGLLWHENIIDLLAKPDKNISIPFYQKLLENICFADYIDRITFQKQIWQFNEMSSLIKTFHNHSLYHDKFPNKFINNPVEVRFTKVLTKYSTEYNNYLFIQNLCQELMMDKKDMSSFFLNLRNQYDEEDIYPLFENYDISKLDINRIYRYLDKYTLEETEISE